RSVVTCYSDPRDLHSFPTRRSSDLVGARQFATVFRQQLSVDVLEDINRAMGAQAEPFLEHVPTPPRAEEGAILVTTADNKGVPQDRKSTRLNSSHLVISYAVFCLKK